MGSSFALTFLACGLITSAPAQFSPALLQNPSYWGDGKAEFNIYGAEVVRDGSPRSGEVLHILIREPMDPKAFVRPEGTPRPDSIAVLKLNQIMQVPVGLSVHQQMHSGFWRVDNTQLLKFSMAGSDSIGNTYKEGRRTEQGFTYEYRTYSGDKSGDVQNLELQTNAYFYDELPWLVRTIDFTKAGKEIEILLAGSMIHPKKDQFEWKPAKLSFTSDERFIKVKLQHLNGEDRFTLDARFPNLLREWTAADGTHLKLKRNLKVDYWNYNKPGDRERALNNPMLRLPD